MPRAGKVWRGRLLLGFAGLVSLLAWACGTPTRLHDGPIQADPPAQPPSDWGGKPVWDPQRACYQYPPRERDFKPMGITMTLWVGAGRVPQDGAVTVRLTVYNGSVDRTFLTERWDGPVVDIVVPVYPTVPPEGERRWSDTQPESEALHRLELATQEQRTIEFTYQADGSLRGPVNAYGLLWHSPDVPGAGDQANSQFSGYERVWEQFILGNEPGFGRFPPSPICRDPLPYEQSLPPVRPRGG